MKASANTRIEITSSIQYETYIDLEANCSRPVPLFGHLSIVRTVPRLSTQRAQRTAIPTHANERVWQSTYPRPSPSFLFTTITITEPRGTYFLLLSPFPCHHRSGTSILACLLERERGVDDPSSAFPACGFSFVAVVTATENPPLGSARLGS